MLEDVKRTGVIRPGDLNREVVPVSPYPRINPQQQRQEGYSQQQPEKPFDEDRQVRRRFTAMRELIEQLKKLATISRVDYNTANQELVKRGLAIAEEELITLLLNLKIPLASIDELVRQLQLRRASPTLTSGRDISQEDTLFPIFVDQLSEYLVLFDELQVIPGEKNKLLVDEITNHGRYHVELKALRLTFSRPATVPPLGWKSLDLAIGIQVGAVEIDENGRRAIFYQRPDKSYGLYSDKAINLSI